MTANSAKPPQKRLDSCVMRWSNWAIANKNQRLEASASLRTAVPADFGAGNLENDAKTSQYRLKPKLLGKYRFNKFAAYLTCIEFMS